MSKQKVKRANGNRPSMSSYPQAPMSEETARTPGEAKPSIEESAESLVSKKEKLAALHTGIFRELGESWAKLAKL